MSYNTFKVTFPCCLRVKKEYDITTYQVGSGSNNVGLFKTDIRIKPGDIILVCNILVNSCPQDIWFGIVNGYCGWFGLGKWKLEGSFTPFDKCIQINEISDYFFELVEEKET